MQLIIKFVFIFTYTFILQFSVNCAENCLPLDDCEPLNQLAEFQSELQNITADVESYIEEQRCKNTSDVLTYECPEIYDGEFHNFWNEFGSTNYDVHQSLILNFNPRKNFFILGNFENIVEVVNKYSQYADAGCYYKKKDAKFKKLSIKQAFFINKICSSPIKVPKQKKWSFFFLLILPFFSVFF